jgi:hypothetical protein
MHHNKGAGFSKRHFWLTDMMLWLWVAADIGEYLLHFRQVVYDMATVAIYEPPFRLKLLSSGDTM